MADANLDQEDILALVNALCDIGDIGEHESDDTSDVISVIVSFDSLSVEHTSLLLSDIRTIYTLVADVFRNDEFERDFLRMFELFRDYRILCTKMRQQLRKYGLKYILARTLFETRCQ